jgi:hypothetical protein
MRRKDLAILERVAVTPLEDRRHFVEALQEAEEADLVWLLEGKALPSKARRKAVQEHVSAIRKLKAGIALMGNKDLKAMIAYGVKPHPQAWQVRIVREQLAVLRAERKAKKQAEKAEAKAAEEKRAREALELPPWTADKVRP